MAAIEIAPGTQPIAGILPAGTMPPVRSLVSPWPGFLTSLLHETRCKTDDRTYGTIDVIYRPDGRPASTGVTSGALSAACDEAASALIGLIEIGPDVAVQTGAQQAIVFHPAPETIACADEPPSPDRDSNVDVRSVHLPRRKGGPAPTYPLDAQRDHTQGTVVIAVTIRTSGCVDNARVIHTVDPTLDRSAITTIDRWTYQPFRINGQPAAVAFTVNVNFTMQ